MKLLTASLLLVTNIALGSQVMCGSTVKCVVDTCDMLDGDYSWFYPHGFINPVPNNSTYYLKNVTVKGNVGYCTYSIDGDTDNIVLQTSPDYFVTARNYIIGSIWKGDADNATCDPMLDPCFMLIDRGSNTIKHSTSNVKKQDKSKASH